RVAAHPQDADALTLLGLSYQQRLPGEPVEGRVAGLTCPLLIREAEKRERVGVLRVGGDPSLELAHVPGGVTRGEPGKQPGEGILLGGGRSCRGDRRADRVDCLR